jgi:FSR family fosmidomycin resistance protein-like MFS transporter
MTHALRQFARSLSGGLSAGVLTFLLIEFYDELAWTLAAVAIPFIRDDLGLTYAQVGLLLGLPLLVSSLIEPVVLLLGDTPLRSRVMVGGGFVVGGAFALAGGAESFAVIIAAMTLSACASGAFVSLSQAVMIGSHPARENEMMARWTAAGTIGDLLGPAALAAVVALGASWRGSFVVLAAAGVALAWLLRARLEFPALAGHLSVKSIGGELLENLRGAMRVRGLWGWLILLPFSDLMLDVFFGYVAVFLVDVDGMAPATAAISALLWILGFLVGQILLVRLLPRQDGRRLVRLSAAATLPVFALWLSASGLPLRLGLLPALGLLASPWYPVLQGQAYANLPGRPATVAALTSFIGSLGGLMAVAVGVVAGGAGMIGGMMLLALGPLVLVLFTPRSS